MRNRRAFACAGWPHISRRALPTRPAPRVRYGPVSSAPSAASDTSSSERRGPSWRLVPTDGRPGITGPAYPVVTGTAYHVRRIHPGAERSITPFRTPDREAVRMPSRVSLSPGLLRSAQQAAATAAPRATDADAQRRLHPEVVQALLDAGFARHFVPARWGGSEGGYQDLLHSVAAVGEACTSAAWCGSVIAGASRMGVYLPEAGQADLWAEGPDAVVVGALMPRGNAVEVPGGWRLTGAWEFTSAVESSQWALVCAAAPGAEGRDPWFFAVPRPDFQVADTWHTVGMRGTASNTLVVDDVFVPRHRGFDRRDMIAGRGVGSRARCHTTPLRLISGVLFGAPALGAARGALASWSAANAPSPGPDGQDARRAAATLAAARAAFGIDSAGLLLERAARVADADVATAAESVRNASDCSLAVERLVDVVEQLFRSAGSTGQLAGHRLQRIWRDVHCLASHTALRFGTAGAAYGSHLLRSAGTGPDG